MSTSWKRSLVAVAVAACVAIPAVAYAAPAASAPGKQVASTLRQDRLQLLADKVKLVLARRKARFDTACVRVGEHITNLGEIASKVEAKGGDVSAVRDLLTQAQAKLDVAKATEAQAVSAFEAVSSSPTPRAAFQDARTIALQASQQLLDARSLTLQAAVKLRQVNDGLKASTETSAAVQ